MAWSGARPRAGGSRRDARRRLTATAAGLAAILLGAILLVMSRVAPDRFSALKGLALDGVAPLWDAARGPVEALSGAAAGAGSYWDAADRVRALTEENRRLRREAAAAETLQNENARLRRLLSVVEPERRRVAVARIAGGAGGGPSETAIISAGTRDGVQVGQPAFAADGLLGRVLDVGARAARVLLVTDAGSRVPVRVARTGAAGLLTGLGSGEASIDFVSASDLAEAVRVGDRLITSGEGGIFPPGVPVAAIIRTETDRAIARPLARPASLGFVIIEDVWLPPPTGVTGGPPPPDQLAAEAAARAAALKAAAEKAAAEKAAAEEAAGAAPAEDGAVAPVAANR